MSTEELVAEMLAVIDASIREGDIEKTLRFVADDVIEMPPDQPTIVGKEALRRWLQKFFGGVSADLIHTPDETTDCGDLVIHRGTVTGALTPEGVGDAVVLNSKYLFVFQKGPDGSLKLWRSMFNSNGPQS